MMVFEGAISQQALQNKRKTGLIANTPKIDRFFLIKMLLILLLKYVTTSQTAITIVHQVGWPPQS